MSKILTRLVPCLAWLLFAPASQAEISFTAAFDAHNSVMLLIDPRNGKIVRANDAATKLYGYPQSALQQLHIQDINLLTPEQVAEERRLAVTENRNFFIFRHKTATGQVRTVEVYSKPVTIDGQELLYSVIHDISDKKATEDSLSHYQDQLEEMVDIQAGKLEAQYYAIITLLAGGVIVSVFFIIRLRRALAAERRANRTAQTEKAKLNDVINATRIGTWEMYVETDRSDINNFYARMLGYEHAELTPMTGDQFRAMLHPDDIEKTQTVMDAYIHGRTNYYECEFRMQHKAGHWIWVLGRGEFVEWADDGTPLRLAGTHQDITERTNADKKLRESEKRFRDFSRSSSDWFWEMDADLRFSYVSERLKESAGSKPVDIIGKTRKEIGITEVDQDHWDTHFATLDRREEFRDFVYANVRDGITHWLSISGVPVFDDNGDFLGYRGTGKNISAQIESEHRLELASEKAEAANRAKSEFLASTSHELRTPMTTVMGFCDLLLDSDIRDSTRDSVERIRSATTSLLEIVNDILDMSKLEEGKMQLEHIDFDLRELLQNIFVMFDYKRRAIADSVVWNTHIADDVPQYINSDPTRIRQILINLIGNAQKFTHEGEISIACGMATHADGVSVIKFSIRDTGIGMPQEAAASIFDEFQQADASVSRKYEGTGLGLAICKRLTALLGGNIDVNSIEKEGSTFTFTVPYVKADSGISLTPRKLTAGSYTATRPLNILLAEDNRVNQLLIQKVLTGYGHHIDIAENGLLAVEAHNAGDYDIILMDVRMPEMDGPDATRAIRMSGGAKANIPIVAATADAVTEHIQGYFDAGMNACVSKPFDWADLVLTINQVLGENIHVPKDDQK